MMHLITLIRGKETSNLSYRTVRIIQNPKIKIEVTDCRSMWDITHLFLDKLYYMKIIIITTIPDRTKLRLYSFM